MLTQIAALLIFLMSSLSIQEAKQPQLGTEKLSTETSSMEIIDLSITLDDQLYPCKVIINEAAQRGGPAILFLHGYGECGTDNERQLTVGLPKHAAENPEKWPYVLIVPQKPIFNTEWQDHEEAILKLLENAEEQDLYDPDHLAITGLSQGGHGTIILAAKYPELFQAAAPVCGYTERRISEDQERLEEKGASQTDPEVVQTAKGLSNIPTWFFHGDIDSVVPVSESRSLFGALKELKANTRYTELADVDHNSWDHAYTDRDLIDWFKEHLKK